MNYKLVLQIPQWFERYSTSFIFNVLSKVFLIFWNDISNEAFCGIFYWQCVQCLVIWKVCKRGEKVSNFKLTGSKGYICLLILTPHWAFEKKVAECSVPWETSKQMILQSWLWNPKGLEVEEANIAWISQYCIQNVIFAFFQKKWVGNNMNIGVVVWRINTNPQDIAVKEKGILDDTME